LILNGALCKDDDSESIDDIIMRRNLKVRKYREYDDIHNGFYHAVRRLDPECPMLLSWAQEAVQKHNNFMVFLGGTLAPQNLPVAASNPETVSDELSSSPLWILGGKPGVAELIADYDGIKRGRDLLTLRQLLERLTALIQNAKPAERALLPEHVRMMYD